MFSSIIIYTCPKCGNDLQEEVIATYPPIYVKKCYSCGWSEEQIQEQEIIRIPYSENKNDTYIPKPCIKCPNHPINGGSGICNCTLGSPAITC